MLVMLQIARVLKNDSLLKASFHEVPGKKDVIGEAFKEITGKPTEFVTQFLKELESKDTAIRFYYCSPEVPKGIRVLLHKSLMNYWRATLPQTRGLIKVSRDLDKKDVFNVLHFDSNFPTPDEYAPIAQDKNPIKLATKVFDALDNGFRHPVDLEFKEGIPESVKELLSSVIDLYNRAIKPKTEVKT